MIKKIQINNFRSIKELLFDFGDNKENIICLLGKNGSGKSNISKAILYFWEHLCDDYSDLSVCDSINPYNQIAEISITFDISMLRIKSQNNTKLVNDIKYIDAFLSKEAAGECSNTIEIKMVQNKKGVIKWHNSDKRIRKIIKSCFPVYYIDTRSLDIYKWEKIWSIITDTSITKPKLAEEQMIDLLNDTFAQIFGSKYSDVEKEISEIFEKQKITFDKYHFDSKFKSAFAMRFGGITFKYDNMNLDFFSDGTNSYKYLLLFIELVSKITIHSSKYPIILLDEPEIGMHPSYISEFVECVCKCIPNNALLMMNTHSPQLIKDMIKTVSDRNNTSFITIYHVYYYRLYTHLKKMKLEFLFSNKEIISLNETNCYFYNAIVYVEGSTEMQLFNNKFLRLLFPKLKQVCFYATGSNGTQIKTVSADIINLGTDYYYLVDIDKIIRYDHSKHVYTPCYREKMNPLNNVRTKKKLNYNYYNAKHFQKKDCLDIIEELLKKEYAYKSGTHYIDDKSFKSLMNAIIKYCRSENVIVNWTTIEGELVTYENIEKFIGFINKNGFEKSMSEYQINQHDEICRIDDPKEKTRLILAELDGRTETQEGTKNNQVIMNGKEIEKCLTNKKTSGWISDWLEFYYNNYLVKENDKLSIFKRDFPSLFNTLQLIENMI